MCRRAEGLGIALSRTRVGVDLGLELSDSGRRVLPKIMTRARAAQARQRRVKKLHLKQAKRRIFNTAVLPSVYYGVEAFGMPPSRVRALRA